MRLRALLETESLGLRLVGGEDELDRTVRGVMTTDLRDPSRYLSGGELVLTGLAWLHDPADAEPFVRTLAGAQVAGLAAGEAEVGGVPEDLVAACAKHRMPLFTVDEQVAFATITEHVVRQVSGERAGDLAAVVDRHRRMMTSGPAGGGPEVVLDLLAADLDLRAWVLSPTGRRVAGAGPASVSGGPVAEVHQDLAGAHLAAMRAGRIGPHRTTVTAPSEPGGAPASTTYSLFPVRTPAEAAPPAPDVRESLLSDWLLAVEADAGDWPAERMELVHGVTQLIAAERAQRDAARTVRRRLAHEVLELIQGGAAPAEIAARLRVATPVLLPGLDASPHWQVVVAAVEWKGADFPPGPVAQALLEELLVGPATGEQGGGDRIAVAHSGEEAVALVPLLSEPEHHGDGGAGEHAATGGCAAPAAGRPLDADGLLGAVRRPLTRGLGEDGRVTFGVSAAVTSAEGLRGALEEARHARRVAAARPGPVCASGHEELASHVLLLPFVPDDVRRAFTARLLEPLRDYDEKHRAELVPTLRAFLECDGSWTRCASRLHLHVNTLRYRVGRIEQLTGRDLSRLEDKLDFFLALRMS
ncbi:PucR family transcriptional regulator ligand-binding domain-containing protein [Streptomyces sp. XM4193]|uniref:PucR family transcriptional regulator n=1 Tax=Streptomyces sp. XM4193 TaxID=2929782 RepID=UPI001FF705DC|nr:PucR family transcriptional regulator ligand-binding domain-containing protein [Streptomyces sp. XM4193]MCK1797146.1 PucR family transcriptional regulator ligand-binding domain-containing protein [Streptomyces sp. XM4193]